MNSTAVNQNETVHGWEQQKVARRYKAVFLENEYVRLMLLPEIGGRIHVGFDKTLKLSRIRSALVSRPGT